MLQAARSLSGMELGTSRMIETAHAQCRPECCSTPAGRGSTLSRAEIKIIESDSGRVMPPEREAEIDWCIGPNFFCEMKLLAYLSHRGLSE
jgi:hypothetical protein